MIATRAFLVCGFIIPLLQHFTIFGQENAPNLTCFYTVVFHVPLQCPRLAKCSRIRNPLFDIIRTHAFFACAFFFFSVFFFFYRPNDARSLFTALFLLFRLFAMVLLVPICRPIPLRFIAVLWRSEGPRERSPISIKPMCSFIHDHIAGLRFRAYRGQFFFFFFFFKV